MEAIYSIQAPTRTIRMTHDRQSRVVTGIYYYPSPLNDSKEPRLRREQRFSKRAKKISVLANPLAHANCTSIDLKMLYGDKSLAELVKDLP